MFSKKNKKVINIEGMHCDHCVKRVTDALNSIEGVDKVKVNLAKKEVVITSEKEISDELINSKINELGFQIIKSLFST